MKKRLLFRTILSLALFVFANICLSAQAYKVSSNNLVTNPTFTGNSRGTTVPNWTFSPSGMWNKENNLIYGEDIVIDALGTYSATPTLTATPCQNNPKVIRFDYNEENTGPYSFNIKLGGVTVASFNQYGLAAQSAITVGSGNTMLLDRKFLTEGSWSFTTPIWNNIWHQVEIYVPGYTSGALTFEYVRNGGISRKVRVDNVNLFEAIPTPVPASTSVNLANCSATTYNLNSLIPTGTVNGVNRDNYNYSWSASASGTPAYSTPTAAPVGTYYLFATPKTGCGNNTTTVSLPSSTVSVNTAAGCCGSDILDDGTFSSTQTAGSYTIPVGDTSNGGGTYWKRNFTNNNGQFNLITNAYGTTMVNMINSGNSSDWWRKIAQLNSKICAGGSKTIKFDFVVSGSNSTSTLSASNQDPFRIFLAPAVPSDYYSANNNNSTGVQVAEIWFEDDSGTYSYGGVTHNGRKWYVGSVASGVTVKVNNAASTVNNINSEYDRNVVYTVELTMPQTTGAYGGIIFQGGKNVHWQLDNVSVAVGLPNADSPTTATGSANCNTGLFDLTTVQPSSTLGNTFRWFYDAAATQPIKDITAVPVGTYFMQTLNCQNCPSASTTSFTVNTSSCANISGKIFADYDGAPNGVSNPEGLGQSAGMYAMLVNSGGTVLAYKKVNSDGTYIINATSVATNYYVKISTIQPTVGSAAPDFETLTPNYAFTAPSQINSTAYGTSYNNILGASPRLDVTGSVSGVNFGINSAPIAGNEGGEQCALAANTAFTVPTIYGVDDDPTWRDGNTENGENGTLQRINIKSLTQTNGDLTYNGTLVTATTVIPSYNPALLVFTSGTAGASSFSFTYTFTDAANAESREVGTVSYSFVPNPTITGISTVAVGGTRTLAGSINPGFVPTAWTSSNPAIATVDNNGVVTGVAVGTTTITYTDYIGCSGTMTMNVIAAACLKPATIDAGNTYPSKTAVTILTHTTADNWPNIRQSAHIVMEGNGYGFVPNRVATPETTITAPKIGMMVYDTTAKCLKVNVDGTSTGWKCLTTQTCPN